jgi:hypothetical protein
MPYMKEKTQFLQIVLPFVVGQVGGKFIKISLRRLQCHQDLSLRYNIRNRLPPPAPYTR